ncbi:MAG: LPS export ABC transporter periplasmic protein LptC [Deltaproteobacteria bacterium]|nr:LPS export ABC transporter periplasmic protein LptC [Deltaproteobacteria bacterium]
MTILAAILASLGGVSYKVAEHFWAMKAREFKKNPLKLLDYAPEATLQIKDFRRAKIDGGRKIWEIAGEEARYLREQKEAVIKKPRFTYYRKDGEAIEATGDEGHIHFTDQELERIRLQGGIEVSYQGFILRTDEIVYFKEKNQVLMPGKVSMKGSGLEFDGIGMEIALQEEKIRLLNKVKTKIEPQKFGKRTGRQQLGG